MFHYISFMILIIIEKVLVLFLFF